MVMVSKDTFKQEVLDSEEVVVADFWAPWCMPCKMMEPILEQLASDHEGKVKVVKINVDEEAELAAQFEIVSIPSLLIFNRGEMVNIHVGVVSQVALRKMLEGYL